MGFGRGEFSSSLILPSSFDLQDPAGVTADLGGPQGLGAAFLSLTLSAVSSPKGAGKSLQGSRSGREVDPEM